MAAAACGIFASQLAYLAAAINGAYQRIAAAAPAASTRGAKTGAAAAPAPWRRNISGVAASTWRHQQSVKHNMAAMLAPSRRCSRRSTLITRQRLRITARIAKQRLPRRAAACAALPPPPAHSSAPLAPRAALCWLFAPACPLRRRRLLAHHIISFCSAIRLYLSRHLRRAALASSPLCWYLPLHSAFSARYPLAGVANNALVAAASRQRQRFVGAEHNHSSIWRQTAAASASAPPAKINGGSVAAAHMAAALWRKQHVTSGSRCHRGSYWRSSAHGRRRRGIAA